MTREEVILRAKRVGSGLNFFVFTSEAGIKYLASGTGFCYAVDNPIITDGVLFSPVLPPEAIRMDIEKAIGEFGVETHVRAWESKLYPGGTE
ncbi:MAG: hypothetical protein UT31_C0023G0007 [Parcubacteria group bacterium GW2011_GWF2_39_13b]|nr:MAG: hypothetical protein UT31_C0023G0007 [Parcubacteria group bacterium GW2011_GWF2_39_13b]